jgi:hypothetical protein
LVRFEEAGWTNKHESPQGMKRERERERERVAARQLGNRLLRVSVYLLGGDKASISGNHLRTPSSICLGIEHWSR